jgi:hypothetical protein
MLAPALAPPPLDGVLPWPGRVPDDRPWALLGLEGELLAPGPELDGPALPPGPPARLLPMSLPKLEPAPSDPRLRPLPSLGFWLSMIHSSVRVVVLRVRLHPKRSSALGRRIPKI